MKYYEHKGGKLPKDSIKQFGYYDLHKKLDASDNFFLKGRRSYQDVHFFHALSHLRASPIFYQNYLTVLF